MWLDILVLVKNQAAKLPQITVFDYKKTPQGSFDHSLYILQSIQVK